MWCVKKLRESKDVDQKLTDQWSNKYSWSNFEAYTCAIHKQETGTKGLIFRRELKDIQQTTNDNKFRICKVHVEDVTYIISSCSKISSLYYLPIRHDCKISIRSHKEKEDPECKVEYKRNELIDQYNGTEYQWNVAIKTAVKVRHNRSDLGILEIENKNCGIIEFSYQQT